MDGWIERASLDPKIELDGSKIAVLQNLATHPICRRHLDSQTFYATMPPKIAGKLL